MHFDPIDLDVIRTLSAYRHGISYFGLYAEYEPETTQSRIQEAIGRLSTMAVPLVSINGDVIQLTGAGRALARELLHEP